MRSRGRKILSIGCSKVRFDRLGRPDKDASETMARNSLLPRLLWEKLVEAFVGKKRRRA